MERRGYPYEKKMSVTLKPDTLNRLYRLAKPHETWEGTICRLIEIVELLKLEGGQKPIDRLMER